MSNPRKHEYRGGYSEEDMEEAVQEMKAGMSARTASAKYGIPRSTLLDRSAGVHSGKQGRPTVLIAEEEALIVEMLLLLGEWGFRFTSEDLRHFVKSYLDKKGVKTIFNDNLPTKRFVDCFLARHPQFLLRTTNAIKRSRAALSRNEVNTFFDNFQKSAEGLRPENMWNFDEANLRDNPSSKKCLFKKGTKYCKMVQNTSKQATSIMICGSAAGEMLPPMVIYKVKSVLNFLSLLNLLM
jgi:hypothetical protein